MWYVIKTKNGLQITNIHQHDFRNVLHRAWDYSERKKDRIRSALGGVAFIAIMLAGSVNFG